MNRRKVIQSITAGSLALYLPNSAVAKINQSKSAESKNSDRGSFSIDGNKVKFFNKRIEIPFNMLMLADTHLFRDDDRGKQFQQ